MIRWFRRRRPVSRELAAVEACASAPASLVDHPPHFPEHDELVRPIAVAIVRELAADLRHFPATLQANVTLLNLKKRLHHER